MGNRTIIILVIAFIVALVGAGLIYWYKGPLRDRSAEIRDLCVEEAIEKARIKYREDHPEMEGLDMVTYDEEERKRAFDECLIRNRYSEK